MRVPRQAEDLVEVLVVLLGEQRELPRLLGTPGGPEDGQALAVNGFEGAVDALEVEDLAVATALLIELLGVLGTAEHAGLRRDDLEVGAVALGLEVPRLDALAVVVDLAGEARHAVAVRRRRLVQGVEAVTLEGGAVAPSQLILDPNSCGG